MIVNHNGVKKSLKSKIIDSLKLFFLTKNLAIIRLKLYETRKTRQLIEGISNNKTLKIFSISLFSLIP